MQGICIYVARMITFDILVSDPRCTTNLTFLPANKVPDLVVRAMQFLWQRALLHTVPRQSALFATSLASIRCRASATRSYAAAAFDKKSMQQIAKQWKQKLQGNDVVFYRAPEGVGRTFTFMYISAGVQLLFWYVRPMRHYLKKFIINRTLGATWQVSHTLHTVRRKVTLKMHRLCSHPKVNAWRLLLAWYPLALA